MSNHAKNLPETSTLPPDSSATTRAPALDQAHENRPKPALSRAVALPFAFGGLVAGLFGAALVLRHFVSPLPLGVVLGAIGLGVVWWPVKELPLRRALWFWLDAAIEEWKPRAFRAVAPAAVAAALSSRTAPLIVDCRAPVDYRQAHIAEAVNVPFFEFSAHAHALAALRRPIVVYCYLGFFQVVAAQKLIAAGATDVAELAGGLEGWLHAGEPTTSATRAAVLLPAASAETVRGTDVIYMDCHATTPVDPRVFESMRPFLTDRFGNAASGAHRFGADARAAVEDSRALLSKVLGARAPQSFSHRARRRATIWR